MFSILVSLNAEPKIFSIYVRRLFYLIIAAENGIIGITEAAEAHRESKKRSQPIGAKSPAASDADTLQLNISAHTALFYGIV